MRYRLLIFDFDGTLADSFPAFEVAMQEAISHFALNPIGPEDLPRLRMMGAAQVIRHLGLPLWKVPQVGRFVRERMEARPLRLFAGLHEVLPALADAGLALTVVSSNSEKNVRTGLGPGLAARFATFACGASLFGKAAKFHRVMKRTGMSRAETLAIGDELRDSEAARSVGMGFGAVAWGYTDAAALEQARPAAVFRTPPDLLKLLS